MKTQRLVEYDCFFCDVCRKYIYDESLGDPAKGVAPQTRVEVLPLSWRCPLCGSTKEQLRASTMLDGFVYGEVSRAQAAEDEAVARKSAAGTTLAT